MGMVHPFCLCFCEDDVLTMCLLSSAPLSGALESGVDASLPGHIYYAHGDFSQPHRVPKIY